MSLTPVEIRHMTPGTGFMGYNRGQTDRLLEDIASSFEDVWRERADLADKVEQLEADLVRFKELETLLRTTLISAERASGETKAQARREAELILGEAHAEARKLQRDAIAENERLIVESRKLRAQLRAALETIDDVQDEEDAAPVPKDPAPKDDGQNTWPGEREAA
jgi:cell division initiation protein